MKAMLKRDIESSYLVAGNIIDVELEYIADAPIYNYKNIQLQYGKDFVELADTTVKDLNSTGIGLKFDSDKPDLSDIPLDAMWEMGKAFTYGQKKYEKNNFRNGHKVSRLLAAATRHIYQHLDGETLDPESRNMHLGHAMASLAMAIYSFKNYPENDDRFPSDIKKYEKDKK